MQLVREEFTIRLEEIDSLVLFINGIETQTVLYNNGPVGVSINTKLKSSAVLLLYNCIESMITSIFTKLYEKINAERIQFSLANKQLRQLILGYHHSRLKNEGDKHDCSVILDEIILQIVGNTYIALSFSEINSKYNLYSGNIDARLIRKILKMHGINIEKEADELRSIKKYRNQLAHGERSFEECGREIPLSRLKKMREETSEFIECVIEEVDSFYVHKKFFDDAYLNRPTV